MSNIVISSLLSISVLAHFFLQPIWHKVTPLALHPDARDAGDTCGMRHQFAGMIHSLVNEIQLFTDLHRSGRGEVSTRAGRFVDGQIIHSGGTGGDCGATLALSHLSHRAGTAGDV